MLYMVIERFIGGDPEAVGKRFRSRGRLLPEGEGVEYLGSWMSTDGTHCYQLMESPTRESLDRWIDNWKDLVDFEVVPVLASPDFWRERKKAEGR